MADTGLNSSTIDLMKGVFIRHKDIQKVVIFGSRAKGTYKKNSDIDLAIFGIVDNLVIEFIAGELDELPLPYKFDVKSFENIVNAELKEHISRVGISIYESF